MKSYFVLFLAAATFGWLLVPRLERLGHRVRAYGRVGDDRRIVAIPRLGGIAIFVSTIAAWLVLFIVRGSLAIGSDIHWSTLATLLGPAALVLFLGICDDLRGIRPWRKLLIEILAASIAWGAGWRILAIPLLGSPIHNGALSFLLTVGWTVSVTNAFNLVDGLDGLAGGVALLIVICLFLVSSTQQGQTVPLVAVTMAGALVAFLRFNLPPALIYLGDAGSLFLGFLLALLATRAAQPTSGLTTNAAVYLAFGFPLLDTAVAVVRRLLSGQPIFAADCDHIHHRLATGNTAPRVALLNLYALAAAFTLGVFLAVGSVSAVASLLLLLVGVVAWFLHTHVRYEEFDALSDCLLRTVRTFRGNLAREIRLRKISKRIACSPSLEESWQLLAEALSTLEFDKISFRPTIDRAVPAPLLPRLRRNGKALQDGCATASIPLRGPEGTFGELQLQCSLAGRAKLLGLFSVIETLLPAFENQLTRHFEPKNTVLISHRSLPRAARRHKGAVLAG